MENASKALIIAGAILISILIISFGVIILGQGSEVINNADMSEAEVTSFNGKFEAYEGKKVNGSNVKQMIKVVYQNNIQNSNDAGKQIAVKYYEGTTAKPDLVTIKGTSDPTKNDSLISSSVAYDVKCGYNSKTGLVNSITVTK
ncbi:MAG: hypothetical protein J5881_04950 [Clostridia bacterium]|nr:hypothetical protein [Clostridia bacterium]